MPQPQKSCSYGPDSDIDARYLADKLTDEESETFEEHYFACDRCFDAVQRGAEIRAALRSPGGARSLDAKLRMVPVHRQRRFSAWQPALAAAAVVIVGLGIRQVNGLRTVPDTRRPTESPNVARGAASALTLTSHATGTVLEAAWSSPPGARSYRVRLLATDGSLLFERETADTSIMLSRDVLLQGGPDKSPVYWEVQALNALRSVVATSPVVQAQTSPGPP